MKSRTVLKWAHVAITTAAICLCSCDPRQLPGFQQEAKRQDERITRETQEAIRNSPGLQELDRLCTKEIPRLHGFVLGKMSREIHEQKYLSYGDQSDTDYRTVINFYLNYFRNHGWQLSEEKDGGWGPSRIEVRNDHYRVTVYDKERRGGLYGIVRESCESMPSLFFEDRFLVVSKFG